MRRIVDDVLDALQLFALHVLDDRAKPLGGALPHIGCSRHLGSGAVANDGAPAESAVTM
jgi:hypothetical protein